MSGFTGKALSWSRRGTTLEVVLHRDPCNEIGEQSLAELEGLAAYVSQGAEGAHAMLMYSDRPAGFCAGADLAALHARIEAADAAGESWDEEIQGFIDRIHEAFNALDRAPLTTIAAVHGVCFGGGFELALTCDVRVADRSARFCFPELRLGLVPGFGGIPRLRRDVGEAVVRDLLLTGRSLGSKRAHSVGLVSQLVGRGQAVEVARELADSLGAYDRETAAAAKAFGKHVPVEALAEEKRLFCELIARPTVRKALADFVSRDDAHPYLAPREDS